MPGTSARQVGRWLGLQSQCCEGLFAERLSQGRQWQINDIHVFLCWLGNIDGAIGLNLCRVTAGAVQLCGRECGPVDGFLQ